MTGRVGSGGDAGAGFSFKLHRKSAQNGLDEVRRGFAVLMCSRHKDLSCSQYNKVGKDEHNEQRDSGKDHDEEKIRPFRMDFEVRRRWQVGHAPLYAQTGARSLLKCYARLSSPDLSAPPMRTLTTLETPGSCMVTP